MGARLSSDVVEQERHVGAPAASYARRHVQNGMVHGASHSRGHAADRRRAAWRRRQDRRGRRNLRWRQGEKSRVCENAAAPRSRHVAGRARRKSSLAPRCGRTAKTLKPILVEAIAKETNFRTDQGPVYTEIGTGFASHDTVNHSIKEYVRGDAHTNTVEGYFSIFKRGIYGVYHHVSEQHLKRYLCEFDFRYNERIALGVSDRNAPRKRSKARPVGG